MVTDVESDPIEDSIIRISFLSLDKDVMLGNKMTRRRM